MQALGMEYPGLTAIALGIYDLKGSLRGTSNEMMLESVVAHEVGHQYFFNVVGNDQSEEPWLDEAITQYITGLYFLDMYGSDGFFGSRGSWMDRWGRVNNEHIPIGLPAGEYSGLEYGAIVYGRGPLFLDRLAAELGQEPFDAFLREYYQTNKWQVVTSEDFHNLSEANCDCDLDDLFDEWVYR
jgi:aminopeptidase N